MELRKELKDFLINHMTSKGWVREEITILGKKEIRYFKDGFEVPEYLIIDLLGCSPILTDFLNKTSQME